MKWLVAISFVAALAAPLQTFALDDATALSGLTSVQAVYDVRTSDEGKLQFMFKVIRDTYDETIAQDVKASYVASMRGPTVKMLVRDRYGDDDLHKKTVDLIKELNQRGIRLEACGYALDLYGIEPEDLYEGVTAVGNSLNSLIGYQAKGYSLIIMN